VYGSREVIDPTWQWQSISTSRLWAPVNAAILEDSGIPGVSVRHGLAATNNSMFNTALEDLGRHIEQPGPCELMCLS
jgi:hypothetical protein